MTPHLQSALAISRLIFELGRVYRITTDHNGNLESDTTHSLMLGLVALHLAPHEDVYLDPMKVLLFALVHDIPEAKAGDTPTLYELSVEERAGKNRREAEAIEQIAVELGTTDADWIINLVRRYETQEDLEARFVHTVDKLMPRLAHVENNAYNLSKIGFGADALAEKNRVQGARLRAACPELHLANSLFHEASQLTVEILRERETEDSEEMS